MKQSIFGNDCHRYHVYKVNYLSIMLKTVGGITLCPYRVGDTLMTEIAVNPSNTYPGTSWEMVSVGKVPVGVNVNDADFNSVGKTGGAKSVTLSVDQIPSHEHVGVYYHDGRAISFTTYGGQSNGYFTNYQSIDSVNPNYIRTGKSGGSKGHNNMPPYETHYFWRRTA